MHHFFHGGISASQLNHSILQSSITDQDCEEDTHLIIPAKEQALITAVTVLLPWCVADLDWGYIPEQYVYVQVFYVVLCPI